MYTKLASVYDQIFPYNQNLNNMILSITKPQGHILDVGCATGSQLAKLNEQGFSTYGIDINRDLLKIAQARDLDVEQLNMLDIEQLNVTFDTIYCVGNSLVHLKNEQEIFDFVNKSLRLLNSGGTLLIQIINYDRILDQNITSLPTIKNNDVTFSRNYEIGHFSIKFSTTLNDDLTQEVTLYPIRQQRLISLLKEVGFNDIHCYGSFQYNDFDVHHSQPLVVIAEKL